VPYHLRGGNKLFNLERHFPDDTSRINDARAKIVFRYNLDIGFLKMPDWTAFQEWHQQSMTLLSDSGGHVQDYMFDSEPDWMGAFAGSDFLAAYAAYHNVFCIIFDPRSQQDLADFGISNAGRNTTNWNLRAAFHDVVTPGGQHLQLQAHHIKYLVTNASVPLLFVAWSRVVAAHYDVWLPKDTIFSTDLQTTLNKGVAWPLVSVAVSKIKKQKLNGGETSSTPHIPRDVAALTAFNASGRRSLSALALPPAGAEDFSVRVAAYMTPFMSAPRNVDDPSGYVHPDPSVHTLSPCPTLRETVGSVENVGSATGWTVIRAFADADNVLDMYKGQPSSYHKQRSILATAESKVLVPHSHHHPRTRPLPHLARILPLPEPHEQSSRTRSTIRSRTSNPSTGCTTKVRP
jgi:hypothetical protein